MNYILPLVIISAVTWQTVYSEHWPQWGGTSRRNFVLGALELGDDTWASTLVADNKVYIGHRRGLTVLSTGPKLNDNTI